MVLTENQPFNPRSQWGTNINLWSSVFRLPDYGSNGLLSSFGTDAKKLLHDHFAQRLQFVLRPDEQTKVCAAVQKPCALDGDSYNTYMQDSSDTMVEVSIMEDRMMSVGASFVQNTDGGAVQGHAAANFPAGLSVFGIGRGSLNTPLNEQVPKGTVGVEFNTPISRQWLQARSGDSSDSFGRSFHTGLILKYLGLQVGASADLDIVGSEYTDDQTITLPTFNSQQPLAVEAKNINVRALYSGAAPSQFTSDIESFQLGLSIENSGERVAASYFHNIAFKTSPGAPHPIVDEGLHKEQFVRSVSFGGEFSPKTQTINDGTSEHELLLGASFNLFENVAFKARVSSQMYGDVMGSVRLTQSQASKIQSSLPTIDFGVVTGLDLKCTSATRFGMWLSVGE
eukprot:m.133493 g.133493  ORF g.133493 m.133493 type:complete len:397 (-) comp29676_c1_seq1:40-1230(-)